MDEVGSGLAWHGDEDVDEVGEGLGSDEGGRWVKGGYQVVNIG